MKRVIASILYAVILFLCLRQGLNYFYNEHVLDRFRREDYSINDNLLLTANFIEPYIAYYNNGNINYMNRQYEAAIEDYQNALNYPIPDRRECPIRINLALAMIKNLGDDYNTPSNAEHSLEVLYEARDVLLEEGCAQEDGHGHSTRAERLKRDIERAIEELENMVEPPETDEPEPSDSSESSESDPSSSDSSDGSSQQSQPSDTSDGSSQPSDSSDGSSGSDSSESSSGSETSDGSSGSESSEGSGSGSETTLDSFQAYESSMQSYMQSQQSAAYSQRQEDLQEYGEYSRFNTDYDGIW